MNANLTPDQAIALAACQGEPLRLKDPKTNITYVLLPADLYERLRGLLGDTFDPEDAYAAVDEAFAPGWNDPKMAEYDRYEEFGLKAEDFFIIRE